MVRLVVTGCVTGSRPCLLLTSLLEWSTSLQAVLAPLCIFRYNRYLSSSSLPRPPIITISCDGVCAGAASHWPT